MHDDVEASHEYSCQEKLRKKRETKSSKASMSNVDRSISFHNTKGSQTNEYKFAVCNVVKNDNISKSDLARKIRAKRGSKDWYGCTYDKEFQAIKQCVNCTEGSLSNAKNFNLDLFKICHQKKLIKC